MEEQPLDTNVVTKDLLNEKSTPSKLSASEVSQSQISTPVAFEAEKSKFLELMGDFETDLKSRVQAFPRLLLSQEYLNILDKLEKDIVSLVSQNRYTDAINTLNSAKQTIENLIETELREFDHLIKEADAAWQKKEIDHLGSILSDAIEVYTENQQPILHYSALATDWPAVSAAMDRANTALAENRLAEEIKSLMEISGLKHDITDLRERLDLAKGNLHKKKVNHLLDQITREIQLGAADKAKVALTNLKRLSPKTAEISKLTADLKQLEEQIKFNAAMQDMDKFAASDNWADAYKVANTNRPHFQDLEQFQQRADFVEKVYNLILDTSNTISSPDQLIKKSNQDLATKLIADANTIKSFSLTLSSLSNELENMLNEYKKPLNIIILSDTHTFVEVKSVGQVGKISEKTIQLLPGDYVFEGKRKGYVTTRVSVSLRPGDSDKKISVIANEQI